MEKLRVAEIQFAGTTSAKMRKRVERLFFLNPRQRSLIPAIKAAVAQTGTPRIAERGERIYLEVPSGAMQCLFASDGKGRPVAVALYGRPEPAVIWISHLAVDSNFKTDRTEPELAAIMVNKILEIARRVEGVTRLRLPYRNESFLKVR
jgi:hypothetical protein